MTLGELLENILLDIDEEKYDTDMTNKITKFINRGYRELAKREGLSKTKEITLTNGKAKIPYDCAKVYSCLVDNANVEFKVLGKNIYSNNDKVTLFYNYIPDLLEYEDDEFETNENNVEFIMLFAKYLYYFSESLSEEAATFKTEYENYRIEKSKPIIGKIIDVYGVI